MAWRVACEKIRGVPGARMRWLCGGLAVVASGVVLGVVSLAPAAAPSVRSGAGAPPGAEVLTAHALPGDHVVAGPVVVEQQLAVWAEVGEHRLLLRSLDGYGRSGHVMTIFSTRTAPGVSRRAAWPFTVSTLVAAGRRLAFVEQVAPCISAPPKDQNVQCRPVPTRNAWNSSTVWSGRLGALKPLEATRHLCARGEEPLGVGIASQGLVVLEMRDPCRWGSSRLVLRSFGGSLLRVIAPGGFFPIAASGAWAVTAPYAGHWFHLRVLRVSTGQTVLRQRRGNMNAVAIEGSGRFAFLAPMAGQHCQPALLGRLSLGGIETGRTHVLTDRAELNADISARNTVALAGSQVAYIRSISPCSEAGRVVVASPSGGSRPVSGLAPASSLAFDGHLLATIHANTIQLTATDCPHPSIPVPANEPVYGAGTTELVSGLYVQGGPVTPPPCQEEPWGPEAGTIQVTNPRTGASVASQTVANGHLAHIGLAPGRYDVTGHFSSGFTSVPVRFTVRQGYRTRQDTFEDVP